VKIAKAVHTIANVVKRATLKGSLYTTVARRNIKLGPMYCTIPKVEYLIRLAAAVKQSKGAVVIIPANNSKELSCAVFAVKLPVTVAKKA
jgi:hypothetical protein